MSRIDAGNLEGAAADIDAVYAMARHLNENPFIIELLVGISIDATAFQAEQALIATIDSASEVEGRRKSIENRPSISGLAESYERCERFMALDLVQEIDREARGLAPAGTSMVPGPPMTAYLRRVQTRMIDTTECSIRLNRLYDEMAAALQLPLNEKEAAFKALDKKLDALASPNESRILPFFSASNLNDGVIAQVVSGVKHIDEAYRRLTTRAKLLDVACAARLFSLANGRPPTNQTDLVPRYLEH